MKTLIWTIVIILAAGLVIWMVRRAPEAGESQEPVVQQESTVTTGNAEEDIELGDFEDKG